MYISCILFMLLVIRQLDICAGEKHKTNCHSFILNSMPVLEIVLKIAMTIIMIIMINDSSN